MEATVREITEEYGEKISKAGKKYNAMRVEVETVAGESINLMSFDEIGIGQIVQLEKNGEYWNIAKPKKRVDVNLDPVIEILRLIYKQNQTILKGISALQGIAPEPNAVPDQTGLEKARAKAAEIKKRAEAKPEPEPLPPELDEVYDDIGDEPINLDDIPF